MTQNIDHIKLYPIVAKVQPHRRINHPHLHTQPSPLRTPKTPTAAGNCTGQCTGQQAGVRNRDQTSIPPTYPEAISRDQSVRRETCLLWIVAPLLPDSLSKTYPIYAPQAVLSTPGRASTPTATGKIRPLSPAVHNRSNGLVRLWNVPHIHVYVKSYATSGTNLCSCSRMVFLKLLRA